MPIQLFVLHHVKLCLNAVLLILAHVRKLVNLYDKTCFLSNVAVCTTPCVAGLQCTAPDTCSRKETTV